MLRRLAWLALVATTAALVAVILVVATGGTDAGPVAPPVGQLETVCTGDVCVRHPAGWDVEVGEGFLTFAHPADPAQILGSVGKVNMRGLVEGAGGTWPAPPAEAARAFFELLGETQDAGMDGDPQVLGDGSVAAQGTLEGLRIWYRLVPRDGEAAVGIEIRAPNRTWQGHADAWRDGLVIGGSP